MTEPDAMREAEYPMFIEECVDALVFAVSALPNGRTKLSAGEATAAIRALAHPQDEAKGS